MAYLKIGPTVCPETSPQTTNLSYVKSHEFAELIFSVAEVQNHPRTEVASTVQKYNVVTHCVVQCQSERIQNNLHLPCM